MKDALPTNCCDSFIRPLSAQGGPNNTMKHLAPIKRKTIGFKRFLVGLMIPMLLGMFSQGAVAQTVHMFGLHEYQTGWIQDSASPNFDFQLSSSAVATQVRGLPAQGYGNPTFAYTFPQTYTNLHTLSLALAAGIPYTIPKTAGGQVESGSLAVGYHPADHVPKFLNYGELTSSDRAQPLTVRFTCSPVYTGPRPIPIGLGTFGTNFVDEVYLFRVAESGQLHVLKNFLPGEPFEFTIPAGGISPTDRGLRVQLVGQRIDLQYPAVPSSRWVLHTEILWQSNPNPNPILSLHRLANITQCANPNGAVDESIIPVTETAILGSLPVVQKGLIADGVTPLIVKVNLGTGWNGGPVHLHFDAWSGGSLASSHPALMVLGPSGWTPGADVTVDPATGVGYALIQGIPTEAVTTTTEVTANLVATLGPNPTSIPITFRKPPVVLVHGIESDSGTWAPSFRDQFSNNGRRTVRAINYPHPTTGQFGSLANALDTVLINQIEASSDVELSKQNWAMTRYDVVGHSQGGVLLRMLCTVNTAPMKTYFTGQLPWKGPHNFNRGRFRRVVTIGAPHNGAILLPWVRGILEETTVGDAVRNIPVVQYALQVLQRFDPFGAELQHINHGAFKVDQDARFHLVSTHIQGGTRPSPIILANVPLYRHTHLWDTGILVFPNGSDGIVEPESAEAGRFSRPQTDPTVTAWDAENVSHAPSEHFGTGPEQSQTSNIALARHIRNLLDTTPAAFGEWVRPAARPVAQKQEILDALPNSFSVLNDVIRVFVFPPNAGLNGTSEVAKAATTTYHFEVNPSAPTPQSGTIQWTASLHGTNGLTREGVTIIPDPSDQSRVIVSVDETVVGEVVLGCTYVSEDDTVIIGSPKIVTSRLPDVVQLGIEVRPHDLALVVGSNAFLEIWRTYVDGSSILAFVPPGEAVPIASSNAAVLDIKGSNRAVALAQGSALVTATLDGFQTQTSFTVANLNLTPAAASDSADAHAAQVAISVLANDASFSSGSLSISAVTQPANGSVAINGNQVTYTPGATFRAVASDVFQYTATDSAGQSSNASVTVTKQNTPPLARTDLAVAGNEPAIFNVVVNDSDGDGDTLLIAAIAQPTAGTATIVANGIQFTPPAGQWSRVEIPYTVADGYGGEAGSSLVVFRSGEDYDHDGQLNDGEILAGTDPGNSASSFKISFLEKQGTGITVSWNGRTGVWYSVQRSFDLSTWHRVGPWYSGTEAMMSHTSTEAEPQRRVFYRVITSSTEPAP